jgi:hypothetical protein
VVIPVVFVASTAFADLDLFFLSGFPAFRLSGFPAFRLSGFEPDLA